MENGDKFNPECANLDLLHAILESEYSNIFFKDRESRFINVSKAQMYGFNCKTKEEVIGKTDFDFFSHELASEAFRDEQAIMATGKPILNKIEKLRWSSGEFSWGQVNKYPLYDKQGNIVGTWGICTNITNITNEKHKLEEVKTKLEDMGNYYKKQAVIDDMTELFNRRKFYEELHAEYEKIKKHRRKDVEFCIAFVDIDSFKSINDHLGHQFGDFLISETAAIIRASVRSEDIVFRYGGDEFLILYKQTCKKEALAITDRIRQIMASTYFTKNGKSTRITISGGVACSSEADDVDTLTQTADTRLYEAKAKGKDNIACGQFT
jgi:diguanylate cyclase (GGDEF)-like protein/PAS domain S-box-containing protein